MVVVVVSVVGVVGLGMKIVSGVDIEVYMCSRRRCITPRLSVKLNPGTN